MPAQISCVKNSLFKYYQSLHLFYMHPSEKLLSDEQLPLCSKDTGL